MSVTLEDMMAVKAPGCEWIRCSDRQPPAYGTYMVIKRGRSHHLDYDEYLWNGSGWVTHGHSLSYAVEAWYKKRGTQEE